ncbi:MAG TPA: CoA pyrophosphatase [Candidatus Binatia bacterium]|nr:CoA pyrophosphatase [Candidatus Binatia bacterium]
MTESTRAAVLVPVCTVDDDPHVVFIRRSHDAPVHGGDMAFPGGRHDPKRDDSLLATALREAEEEIGLAAADVELMRALPEVRTLSSNFLIAPFIGRIPHPYAFTLDAREVAAVTMIGIAQLRAPTALQRISRRLTSGFEVDADAFVVGPHVIWGATYRIAHELLRVLG